jgi:hypothetical protein
MQSLLRKLSSVPPSLLVATKLAAPRLDFPWGDTMKHYNISVDEIMALSAINPG